MFSASLGFSSVVYGMRSYGIRSLCLRWVKPTLQTRSSADTFLRGCVPALLLSALLRVTLLLASWADNEDASADREEDEGWLSSSTRFVSDHDREKHILHTHTRTKQQRSGVLAHTLSHTFRGPSWAGPVGLLRRSCFLNWLGLPFGAANTHTRFVLTRQSKYELYIHKSPSLCTHKNQHL